MTNVGSAFRRPSATHAAAVLAGSLLGCLTLYGALPAGDGLRTASISPVEIARPASKFEAIPADPDTELLYILGCMAAFHEQDYPLAESRCATAVRANPANPGSRKMLGAVYLMESRYSEAEMHFSAAKALDPADPEIHAGLGYALRGQSRFAEAAAAFGSAINLAPGDAQFWNARCWTRGAGSIELKAALSDCDEALKLAPGYASAYDSRGFVNLRLGRNAAAVRDYGAAIRLNPRFASALYGRGVARDRLGQLRAGARDRAAAHKIDPEIDSLYASYGIKPATHAAPARKHPTPANPRSATLERSLARVSAVR